MKILTDEGLSVYDGFIKEHITSNIESSFNTKEDKPTTTPITESSLTVTLETDSIFPCGELTSLIISPSSDIKTGSYADISFTSGNTATNVTAPTDALFSGTDCIDNVFVPVSNTRYNVVIWYDGSYIVGSIQGNRLGVGN